MAKKGTGSGRIALRQEIIDAVWDRYVGGDALKNKEEWQQLAYSIKAFVQTNTEIVGASLFGKYSQTVIHESTLHDALSRKTITLGASKDLRDLLCLYAYQKKGWNWKYSIEQYGSTTSQELETHVDLKSKAAGLKESIPKKQVEAIPQTHSTNETIVVHPPLNSETTANSKVHSAIHILDAEYWKKKLKKAQAEYKNIDINFRLYAEEFLTDSFVALQAHLNPLFCQEVEDLFINTRTDNILVPRTIDEVMQKALTRFLPSLIKIFAPSGEGKSVLLGKIGYYYSHQSDSVTVIRLESVSKEILFALQTFLLSIEKPVIVILDSPHKYDAILKRHLLDIRLELMGKRMVFVIADQELRYDQYLMQTDSGEEKFESFFSHTTTMFFEMSNDEKARLFSSATLLFSKQNPEIHPPVSSSDFFDKKKTLRELLLTMVSHGHDQPLCKHEHDWEIYNRIISKSSNVSLRPLFALVSVFSLCEVRVPLSLFDEGYLANVTSFTLLELLRRSPDAILRIDQDGYINLRHEEVAKWYFKQASNQDYGLRVLKMFLELFEKKLDEKGCYLFRNISQPIRKTFLAAEMPLYRVRETLNAYLRSHWKDGSSDPLFAKIMLRLVNLESGVYRQLELLDLVIKNYPKDFRAKTKRAAILLDMGRTDEAKSIYNELIADGIYDTYVFELEQKLLTGRGFSQATRESFRTPTNAISVFLDIARKKIRKGQYSQAKAVLDKIKLTDVNRDVKMTLCALSFAQEAYDSCLILLNEIIVEDKNDIEAILYRDTVLIKQKNFELAERKLWLALSDNPNQGQIAGRILDIRRRTNNKESLQQMENLLHSDNSSLVTQLIPFRVKYALWLFQTNSTIEDRRAKAIAVLEENLKLVDHDFETLTALGLIYQRSSRSKKDLDQARVYYETALRTSSNKIQFRTIQRLVEVYQSLNNPNFWNRAKTLLLETKNAGLQYSIIDIEIFKCYSYFNEYDVLAERRTKLQNEGYTSEQIQEWRGEVLHFKNIYLLNVVKEREVTQDTLPKIATLKLALSLEDLFFSFQTRRSYLKAEIAQIVQSNDNNKTQNPLFASLQILAHAISPAPKNDLASTSINKFKSIEDLYFKHQYAPDVALAMSYILLKSYHKRLSIFVLDKLDLSRFTSAQKIRILLQKLHLYKLLKAHNEIVDTISTLKYYSTGIKLNYLLNARLVVAIGDVPPTNQVSIWNSGKIYPNAKYVISNGNKYQIDSTSLNLVKNFREGEAIFFSTYKQENKMIALDIERFFDKRVQPNYSRLIRVKPNQLYSITGWVSKILGVSVTEYAEEELKIIPRSKR